MNALGSAREIMGSKRTKYSLRQKRHERRQNFRKFEQDISGGFSRKMIILGIITLKTVSRTAYVPRRKVIHKIRERASRPVDFVFLQTTRHFLDTFRETRLYPYIKHIVALFIPCPARRQRVLGIGVKFVERNHILQPADQFFLDFIHPLLVKPQFFA